MLQFKVYSMNPIQSLLSDNSADDGTDGQNQKSEASAIQNLLHNSYFINGIDQEIDCSTYETDENHG